MYAKGSPFNLALGMLALSELKERSHELEPTGRVNTSDKMVDMFSCDGSLLVANFGFAVLHLPTH